MPKYLNETDKLKEELYQKVFSFMVGNHISCVETIYQTNHVIENAYEFIEELFNIIEPNLPLTEYED